MALQGCTCRRIFVFQECSFQFAALKIRAKKSSSAESIMFSPLEGVLQSHESVISEGRVGMEIARSLR